MKNKLLPLIFVLGSCSLYSQVGIGTPMPNSSSQLEVVANDKGVLIPRIKLKNSTDATTIVNGNVNSLLVFNTETVADIKPGYFYWYNNKWNRIVVSSEINASAGTVVYNPVNQDFNYIDASGNNQIIDLSSIVKANETLTTLTSNGKGLYTYKNELGDSVSINVIGDVVDNFSTIVNNPSVTTIINEIVKKTAGNVTFNSSTNQFSYLDEAGTMQLFDISAIVKAHETETTLISTGNGTYIYANEKDSKTTIDVVGDVVNNASTIVNSSNFVTELTNVIKNEETL
ncbi:hypothetical protein ACWA1B_18935, partial [Flavobacterium sp. 3-210]